ncbi:hypothetical protein KAR48_03630 [bacterium]|nr:hypothetical protein [bacterium]
MKKIINIALVVLLSGVGIATNIAEEVIFIYKAESIKHGQVFKDVRSR